MESFAIRSPRSGRQKGSLPQVVSLSPAYAGLSPLTQCHPGLADSALGYMLSPATRVAAAHTMSPRARGLRPGLYAVARYAGCRRSHNVTQGSRTPPWAICCRPLRGLPPLTQCHPGLADSPWAICCRPLRGLPAVPSWWMRADQLRPGQGIISNNDAVSSVLVARPMLHSHPSLTAWSLFLTSTIHSRI